MKRYFRVGDLYAKKSVALLDLPVSPDSDYEHGSIVDESGFVSDAEKVRSMILSGSSIVQKGVYHFPDGKDTGSRVPGGHVAASRLDPTEAAQLVSAVKQDIAVKALESEKKKQADALNKMVDSVNLVAGDNLSAVTKE